MKTYKSSDLTHKRAEVMREAAKNGVIIQECRSNGEVIREFVMVGNNGQSIYGLYDSHDSCKDEQCQICSYDW